MRRRRAFTVLELLVVVAILATLAGGLVASMDDVQAQASVEIARADLATIRDAVRRFRADTGFLPKQGPFRLIADGGLVATPDGEDPNWFHSPANLSQLYLAPVDGMGDAVNPWSPTRRRGWNGPYLSRSVVGAVALNDGLAPTGVGGGFEDGVAITAPVPGAADPFSLGSGFTWTFPTSGDSATLGAPYLLFDLDDPARARVVSAGADGIYTPLSVADGRLVEPGSDDLGLHLVQ